MAGAWRALRRLPPDMWLALQGTVAATLAWVIAEHVVGDHDPFFAPIAAFAARPHGRSRPVTRTRASRR